MMGFFDRLAPYVVVALVLGAIVNGLARHWEAAAIDMVAAGLWRWRSER